MTAEFTLAESESAVFSLEEVRRFGRAQVWQKEEALDQLMATVRFWWGWLSRLALSGAVAESSIGLP